MHGAARNMQHRHKRVVELEERALINLPFPIPSIPILDPLLKPLAPLITPLIDGEHPATTSTKTPAHTTSTTPAQAPAPAPTTAAPSPTSPNAGDTPTAGSGSANGGGGSPGNTSPNGGGGGSGGSSGGSPAGAPSNGGATNSPAPGSNPAAPASGAAAASPSGSGVALPDSFLTGSVSGAAGSSGEPGSDPSSGSAGSSGGGSDTASIGVVVNANGAAFVSGTSSALAPGVTGKLGGSGGNTSGISANAAWPTDAAGRITGSPAVGGPSDATGSDASSTSNANPSEPSNANGAGGHHGVSTGIIAAISVIVGLLLLLLLVFCCRRRAIAKRLRRRRTWFTAGAYRGGEEYKDGAAAGGTRSARSSFATHFDRGDMVTPSSQIDLSVTPSSSEEMSQVWPSNLSGSITVPPVSRTVESTPSPTIRAAPDRSSMSSVSSSGSLNRAPSQASQYLTAPDPAVTEATSPYGVDFPSPFSVRPFSPSETFSFPRPPQDDAHSRASGIMSGSVVSGSISSAAFFTAEDADGHSPPSPVAPVSSAAAAENPFLDFTEIRPPSASASLESANSTPLHFAPVETIMRPFAPTMADEMGVSPGQEVRIVRRFDDGWAFAEDVESGRQGLIPIDCLRPVEEDLPAFLAKKRLSSYGAGARASALSALSGASVGKAV